MASSCVRRSHTIARIRYIGKVDVFGMKSRGRALIPGLGLIERVTKARDASLSKQARVSMGIGLCCVSALCEFYKCCKVSVMDESDVQRDTTEPDDHPIASESLR
jgi:hypothetical protein